jgi:CheY-like chemotaxis protein
MDGLEATRRLKADPCTKGCLVVVVTGAPMAKFEEACAAGCDAFFRKPFDPSALEHVLRARPASRDSSPVVVSLPEGVLKRCRCGSDYSRSRWLTLVWGGQVRLPGRGAVIELRHCTCGSSMALRLEDPGAPVGADRPDAEAAGEPALETVFIVDRDIHVRRLALHFIGNAYLVRFFDDGYSALDAARKTPPSALIAEIMSPRLDGLALCRLLKGEPATAQVPVLLLGTLAAGDRARQAGADTFLQKPLEKEGFIASLLGVIGPSARRGTHPPPGPGAS